MKTILRYKLVILIVMFFSAKTGYSQLLDTSLILKHLKLRLFSEVRLSFLSNGALNDYYKRELKVTVLEAKGFDNFIFFKISSQILAIDTVKEKNEILTYLTPVCLLKEVECYFVYAFNKNNNQFIKLKGTNENDFESLYNSLQEEWMYWKPAKKINNSLIKQFTKDYWVNGLDLTCLLRSLKGKEGSCLDYFSPRLIVH